ncbi:hypothetical protein [Actinomyces sp. MRS3W]|uniref:hypothetical protein n=1 Tax=Actinomyces sp. MRS3W TaxID=2800796 RepID=UPI0028FDBA9C|nr:hypothetical protein [Actinomyces sp. MRS3W]MDU0347711.1 hypothetical protein [Actinomyces sp. MRS3W]
MVETPVGVGDPRQRATHTPAPFANTPGSSPSDMAEPADDAFGNSFLMRASSVIYQAAALGVGALPLIVPAAVGLVVLDGASAWSLVTMALIWTFALTALPAVVYAVTWPGWTTDPSARRRMAALWRGWAGAIAQFGPIALGAVVLLLGLTGSAAGAGSGLRLAIVVFLAVLGLYVGRAGTIVALFSFKTSDLLVLTLVMMLRDASGTLFLAAIGAAGLLIAFHAPVFLMVAWVPLCALAAPATRGQRRILTEQFTVQGAGSTTPAET